MTASLITRLREENELLQEQVRQLRAALVDETMPVPAEYKLTRTEERIYRHLSARSMVTNESIAIAIYGDTDDASYSSNIVPVFIHKLRAKLRPHGIEIVNHWGRGYSLKGRYTEDNGEVAV